MRLLALSVDNFNAIGRLNLELNGSDMAIYGHNATGKTTIADAISWLLFGKDSRGQADFGVKHWSDKDKNRLDHELEATFDIGGNALTLKKVFKEKWTRKRGSAQEEFTGHTTEYFVDGVPKKEKDCQALIAEICPEHLFSLLTSPTAFSALHWQKQRATLLEVCGDVSDADIIASNPDFSRLPEILGGKKVDDWKKIAVGRRTEINKRLVEIPARIDELGKSRPELSVTNPQTLISTLTKLRGELDAKNAELAAANVGGGLTQLQNRIVVQEQILGELSRKLAAENLESSRKNSTAVADAQFRLGNSANLQADTARKIAHTQEDILNVTEANQALADKWREVNSRAFVAGPCPTCGQEIPVEQADAARSTFNTSRSTELESIAAKGFANKERLAALNKQFDAHR